MKVTRSERDTTTCPAKAGKQIEGPVHRLSAKCFPHHEIPDDSDEKERKRPVGKHGFCAKPWGWLNRDPVLVDASILLLPAELATLPDRHPTAVEYNSGFPYVGATD